MFRKFLLRLFLYSLGLFNLYCCFHLIDSLSLYSLNLFISYLLLLFCLYCCSGSYMIMSLSYLRHHYALSDILEYRCERLCRSGVGMIYVRCVGDLFWRELCYDLSINKNSSYVVYSSFIKNNLTVGDLINVMHHKLCRDKGFRYSINSIRSTRIFVSICMFFLYLLFLLIVWHSY